MASIRQNGDTFTVTVSTAVFEVSKGGSVKNLYGHSIAHRDYDAIIAAFLKSGNAVMAQRVQYIKENG